MENSLTAQESPMSTVLNNPYLLDLIFEHFGAYGRQFHFNMSLSSNFDPYPAVSTCRAFLTPALNALWRSLTSLIPLLKLLPTFIKTDGDNYSLRGVVNDTDWARFNTYADRVRYFHFEYADAAIPQYVYLRLTQLHISPLLPNLLDFSCNAVDLLGCGIFTFLSPSLQYVYLLNIEASQDDMIGAFLSALVDEAPNLGYLTLHGELSKTSLSFTGRLNALRSLTIDDVKLPVFLQVISHIWTIQNLQILRIDWDLSNNLPGLSNDESLILGLKGLKELTTRNGSLQTITRLMTSIQSSLMETIEIRDISSEIHENGHRDIQKCRHLLEQLFAAWHHWRHTLRCIAISFSPNRNGDSIDIFTPLFVHRNLIQLDLSHFGVLSSFSDTDAYRLAKNWPLMELLFFPPVQPNFEPTIKALADIAGCCPRLKFLQIPINVKLPPLNSTPLLDHGLRSLDVSNAVANTNLVARHLDRLFPVLESVSSLHIEHEEMWAQVEGLLKVFQDIRRESRERKGPHGF